MTPQSVSQIRSDIENTKEHISQTVGEIEERFQEMKDWRSTVYQYPLASVGVAVGLGMLLSGALNPLLLKQIRHAITGAVSGAASTYLLEMMKQRQAH